MENKQKRLFMLYVVLFILLAIFTSIYVVGALITNNIAMVAASILNGLFFGYCIVEIRERIILQGLKHE